MPPRRLQLYGQLNYQTSFRDIKITKFGMGMEMCISNPGQRDRLFCSVPSPSSLADAAG